MPALDGQQMGLAGFPVTEKKAILAKIKKLGATAALIISKKVAICAQEMVLIGS